MRKEEWACSWKGVPQVNFRHQNWRCVENKGEFRNVGLQKEPEDCLELEIPATKVPLMLHQIRTSPRGADCTCYSKPLTNAIKSGSMRMEYHLGPDLECTVLTAAETLLEMLPVEPVSFHLHAWLLRFAWKKSWQLCFMAYFKLRNFFFFCLE